MKPIDVLLSEHRLIEQVLNCLERMAEESLRSGDLNGKLAGDAVAFFRTFVHGWHFPREEAYLARVMDPETPARTDELQFHDHQRCRAHLQEMEQAAAACAAGDGRTVERFAEHAQAYIAVLMKHNEDEELRVFPMVERSLTGERELEAVRALRQIESQITDQCALDACVDAAHRLADRFKVPKVVVSNAGAPS
ncbi:MAG: hemerythrin domain-containing protein [Planctomycetota bacterium]